MAEIASGSDVWRSNRGGQKGGRARKKSSEAPPPFERPQLATLVDEVPPGDNWLFEYKYDGYRLLIATGTGAATAWTRNGKDWSDKFRALVKAAAKLPAGCLIDGEAVALDDKGKPSFQLLQSTLKDQRGANLAFFAFDLLVDRGEDIRRLPNIERKDRLKSLLAGVHPPILFGDHVHRPRRGAVPRNLQGRRRRPHRQARRRALPRRPLAKLAQGQMHPAPGIRDRRLVGKRQAPRLPLTAAGVTRQEGKLTYAGKVGTGFNAQLIEDLMERMEPLALDKAAVEVPRPDRKGAHWIKPKLVAEIDFTEFTDEGILRHPSFIALREDKPAKDVVREVPQHVEEAMKQPKRTTAKRAKGKTAEDFGIAISSPERVIYPEHGLTKRDLADYYATVEPLIMVDAANRPMTLIRCPRRAHRRMLLPEARQRHVRRAREARSRSRRRTADGGLSLLRRRPRAARLRADGHDRIPRLGQQGRRGRISRPPGVRPRSRRRPRFRQGEGGGGPSARPGRRHSASRPSRC